MTQFVVRWKEIFEEVISAESEDALDLYEATSHIYYPYSRVPHSIDIVHMRTGGDSLEAVNDERGKLYHAALQVEEGLQMLRDATGIHEPIESVRVHDDKIFINDKEI